MATATKKELSNGSRLPATEVSTPTVIPEVRPKSVTITIEGTTPLITHKWSEKAIKMIEDKQQKKGTKGREAKVPQEEFESAIYRDDDGVACVPARAIKCAIVEAATSIGDKIRYSKTKLRQCVFVQGDLLPIKSNAKPRMRTDMVALPSGGADVRYRPEWAMWEVTCTIEFNSSAISQDEVLNLLELAGFAVGIGEWRPEKNGSNGRFKLKRNKAV